MREVHIKMNENPQWKKVIRIDLTLEELQIIYDCVGNIAFEDINYKNNNEYNDYHQEWNKIFIPAMLDNVYDGLEQILNDNNGIVD